MGGNNRNFIIAIALSIVVLFGWQYFVAKPQIETARQQAATEETTAANAPNGAAVELPPEIIADNRDDALATTDRVPIATPAISGSINLTGGRIDDVVLNEYFTELDEDDPDNTNIVVLSPANGPNGYFAEFGWVSGDGTVVGSNTLWTAPTGAVLTPETPVTLTYDTGTGLVFSRTISVDDQYMFTVSDSVANTSAADVALTPYGRVTRLGEPPSRGTFILHEGMIGVIGEQGLQTVKYSALEGDTSAMNFEPANDGWLGITDKYWAAVLIPPTEAGAYTAHFNFFRDGTPRFQADYSGTAITVAPGATAGASSMLFAGAKEVAVVDGYDATLGLDRFELLIDWGWFYFITKPMFKVLDFFYKLVGNFGVAILLVTVILKLIFFPLASRSYRSMASMRKVGPQMQAIRERFKDDRAKQQQETLALYKREKINPVSGCWPILIQIPVFFSLYKVLFVTIEMRHQPFFGWIQDLSAPDPTSIANLFGLLPYDAPAFFMIGVWPILMGITMWVQMRLNPQQPGTPQIIFHILPIVFTFMLASFPAGLVIYWTWNNFLSITQQSVIMRRNGVKVNLLGNIRSSFKRSPKKADAKAKS